MMENEGRGHRRMRLLRDKRRPLREGNIKADARRMTRSQFYEMQVQVGVTCMVCGVCVVCICGVWCVYMCAA